MKRIAIKLVIFLLLGAAVNVAVAWGCAAWSEPEGYTTPRDQSVQPRLQAVWSTLLVRSFPDRADLHLAYFRGFGIRVDHVIAWVEFAGPGLASTSEAYHTLTVVESGWPLAALRGGLWCAWPDSAVSRSLPATWRLDGPHYVSVLPLPFENGFVQGGKALLPLRPIWATFVGNTIFYAGVFWLAITFVSGMRRLHRVDRGLCPRCAYERHGDYRQACPECGWLRKGSETP